CSRRRTRRRACGRSWRNGRRSSKGRKVVRGITDALRIKRSHVARGSYQTHPLRDVLGGRADSVRPLGGGVERVGSVYTRKRKKLANHQTPRRSRPPDRARGAILATR